MSIEAAKQSSVVTGKTWLKTTSDEACCDLCDETDGVTVGIEDEFPERDPPQHVNRRCTVLFVLAGEDTGSDRGPVAARWTRRRERQRVASVG